MPEFLYDVALSYASAQREYVRQVASELKSLGRNVFYDEDEQVSLWGQDLIEKLDDVYRKQARYVVMFISRDYADSVWTRLERRSALARALVEREAYVLPARFDDTELPGLSPSVAYLPIGHVAPEQFVARLIEKLAESASPAPDPHGEAGWEWILFANELEAGVKGLATLRADHRAGFARPAGIRVSGIYGTAEMVDQLNDELLVWITNIDRVLTEENQSVAFGEPGEPGDRGSIVHLAKVLTEIYAGILQWVLKVRGVAAPDEAREVLWALSKMGGAPLDQYEAFVEDYCTRVRHLVRQLRAGVPPDESTIIFALRFDIPAELTNQWSEAWDRLRAAHDV